MPLFLAEVSIGSNGATDLSALFARVEDAVARAGGELIEVQVVRDLGLVYAIVEHRLADVVRGVLEAAEVAVRDVAEVRLVGPTLEEVKARKGGRANFLVEWDIPSGTSMEQYLSRKREKAPLYAQVPETSFLRTYVREDMMKCVCLYDAPDEDAVRRAREAVSTPVDRLSRLDKEPA